MNHWGNLPVASAAIILAVVGGGRSTAASSVATAAGLQLTHIAMVNDRLGWGTTQSSVLWTNDGGAKWRTVFSIPRPPGAYPVGPYFAFASIGPDRAWVAATSPQGIWTYLFQGGARRQARHQDFAGSKLTSVAGQLVFSDGRHGWLLLHDGAAAGSAPHAILRTTDGGKTWKRVEFQYLTRSSRDSLSACDGAVASLSFANASQGWATGMCGNIPKQKEVFETQDGGRTWRQLAVPNGVERRLAFFDPGQVVVEGAELLMPVSAANPPQFHMYRSDDRGVTWRIDTQIPYGAGNSNHGPDFSFGPLTARRAWVLVGRGRTLWRTANSGRNWHVMSRSLPGGAFRQLDFVTPRDGFVLYPHRQAGLYVTHDSGRHWTAITPHPA